MATGVRDTPRGVDLTSWLVYNGLLVPPAVAGFHLFRLASPKVREGARGRRGLWQRLQQQSARLRGAVWFHATSVGEYEQARPVIRALKEEARRRGQDVPVLMTVFSPSGWHFARKRCEADALEYLPLDTAGAARRLIALLAPRALVFVKFDCWPNMVWAARRAGVPILLLDATLHRKSRRLMPLARGFFGKLFDAFSAIGAISEDDAARFTRGLGVRAAVTVTGDTRAEQVVHRWRAAEQSPLAQALAVHGWRYIALGSVWPADEGVVLAPALDALQARSDVGLIAVPHEPTPAHLESVEAAVRARGLRSRRLSELVDLSTRQPRAGAIASAAGSAAAPPAESAAASAAASGAAPSGNDRDSWRIIVVDTVGVLAEIYRATIVSYVGGSFTTGVHNVMEPSVAAQPVLFGPRIHNAYEAERLAELGAAFVVLDQASAARRLQELLDDETRRAQLGQAAQEFVLAQQGATAASLELMRPFVFGAGS
jgi:3-deoxy-D-manno-octulosonic-acid transferase